MGMPLKAICGPFCKANIYWVAEECYDGIIPGPLGKEICYNRANHPMLSQKKLYRSALVNLLAVRALL